MDQQIDLSIEKQARKFFSKLGFSYATVFVAIFGSQILLEILAIKIAGREILDNALIISLLTALPVDVIGTPVLYLIIKKIETTKLEQRSLSIGSMIRYICMLAPITLIGALISTILSSVIGAITGTIVDNNMVLENIIKLGFWGRIVTACICAPIFEELIFRKLLIDRTVRYGEGLSIILSGVLFGLFHGNFEQFFYACFLGMFFAYIYIKTGKIQYTMLLHFAVNFTSAGITSTLITHLDIEQMQKILGDISRLSSLSQQETAAVSAMLPWMVAYFIWSMILVCVFIAGIVFWILELVSKPRFEERSCQVPRDQQFKTVYCNLGMGLYITLGLAMCVYVIVIQMIS